MPSTARSYVQSRIAVFGLLSIISIAGSASASSGPAISLADLASGSQLIVIGQTRLMQVARDPVSGGIYTYVTIDVDEVFQGPAVGSVIVLKQAGGVLDDVGMWVPGQAIFEEGERVLVFLEARPRDGTLYTSALWQGKWTIVDDATGGATALRQMPGAGGATERVALGSVRAALALAVGDRAPAEPLTMDPPERVGASPYRFFDPPSRWMTSSVAVDIASYAQPGLPGGGFAEIAQARNQWNALGGLALVPGTSRSFRCIDVNENDGRILITFDDPCNDVDDSGNTFGYAYFYYSLSGSQTVNGMEFARLLTATITTNNTANSRTFLSYSGCFQSLILHEMGHAIGFDHSADVNAIMYPIIGNGCFGGPLPLGADDITMHDISYPTTPPGRPTVTAAAPSGGTLNISWSSSGGGAATSHRLDFYSGGAFLASVNAGATTSFSIPLPPGLQGTFSVIVTPFSGTTAGPASAPFSFTLGTPPTPPGTPTVTQAQSSGGSLNVAWTLSAGAAPTSHRLDFYSGGALLASVPSGSATTVSIPLPPGIQGAFTVRVTAFNDATAGPTSAAFAFTLGCTAAPAAPSVSGSIVNGNASVSWPQVSGATSYIFQAGSSPGGTNYFPATSIASQNSVSASGLPPGFQAYIRVTAVNACGQSAPIDFLLQ